MDYDGRASQEKFMAKHRTYSIDFKRQIAQEYLFGEESLHGLANLSPPTIGSCDHSDKVVVQDGQTETLLPGRYCKGLEINTGRSEL